LKADWIHTLKKQSGKDLWLMGGSSLFRSLLDASCVDAVEVSVIPVLLGDGVPLLPPPYTPKKLKLRNHHVYRSGRVALAYDVLR
jgi:dihydrofolate reductase